MARIKYIAVAGNIGCGKSTLVNFATSIQVEAVFEPNADNPYLKTLPRHEGLYFQVADLLSRPQVPDAAGIRKAKPSRDGRQDRTIYECRVFAAYLPVDGVSQRDAGLSSAL